MEAGKCNQDLRILKEQIAEYQHACRILDSLRNQQRELRKRENDLSWCRRKEQEDVERLEGRSLANFFYQVVGKMDEKLDQERREAYEAAVKHDAVVRELESVEYDIQKAAKKVQELRGCEAQYERALKERLDAIRSSKSAEAENLIRLEREMISLEQKQKEVREAAAAGKSALSMAEAVLSSLDSAEGWGTWDLFGGGTFSAIAKHQHLDEAQYKVEEMQVQLRRFRTELEDVAGFQEDIQVSIQGFTRFADLFFDNMFVDWAVLDKIKKSKSQILDIQVRIQQILSRLKTMESETAVELHRKQTEIDETALQGFKGHLYLNEK